MNSNAWDDREDDDYPPGKQRATDERIKYSVKVTFTADSGATRDEIEEFVRDALSTWGGQRHPDDPLFSSFDVATIALASHGKAKL